MADLHIIFTEAGEEYGWTIESPQLPELIGGNNSVDELVAETPRIVEWAAEPGTVFGQVFGHEQHVVRDPDGNPFVIRWQFDDGTDQYDRGYAERYETASRLNYAVTAGLESESLSKHPAIPTTDERMFIVVLGHDTMGWVLDQLSDRDDCCVLAHHLGNGAVVHIPFGRSGILRDGIDTDLLGLDRDSTVDDMTDAVLTNEVESLRKIYFPEDAISQLPRHMPENLHLASQT